MNYFQHTRKLTINCDLIGAIKEETIIYENKRLICVIAIGVFFLSHSSLTEVD